jgi:hypothetical protein
MLLPPNFVAQSFASRDLRSDVGKGAMRFARFMSGSHLPRPRLLRIGL